MQVMALLESETLKADDDTNALVYMDNLQGKYTKTCQMTRDNAHKVRSKLWEHHPHSRSTWFG